MFEGNSEVYAPAPSVGANRVKSFGRPVRKSFVLLSSIGGRWRLHARRSIVLYTLSQVVRVRVLGLVVLIRGAPFTLTQ